MRVTIAIEDMVSFKTYLRHWLPDQRPSHRIEAAARGLGFRTYDHLRRALEARPMAVEADDLRFCATLGIPFVDEDRRYNRCLSRALARIELHRVLHQYPLLTQRGFDSIWLGGVEEMALADTQRMTLLAERRHEAYESESSFDQFELAWMYLSRKHKGGSINRVTGSYVLKHRAENLVRELGLFETLGSYVSNGMLIAAAYALGFTVKPIGPQSYDAYFNIVTATVHRSRRRQSGSAGRSGPDAAFICA